MTARLAGQEPVTFAGMPYLLNFANPNFYFHVTTAHDILRHCGVEAGKWDVLGKSRAGFAQDRRGPQAASNPRFALIFVLTERLPALAHRLDVRGKPPRTKFHSLPGQMAGIVAPA